jgi:hypothetical protein
MTKSIQFRQLFASRMHRENMLRTLLQRMEIAKQTGNRTLLVQLQQEKRTLGL